MMNDDLRDKAKERVAEALRETQAQTEEAAAKLNVLLRKGAAKLREAAGTAADAIRNDLNSRR